MTPGRQSAILSLTLSSICGIIFQSVSVRSRTHCPVSVADYEDMDRLGRCCPALHGRRMSRLSPTEDMQMTIDNATLRAAGVEAGSRLAQIVEGRADIMALTQSTEGAVFNPRVAGGLSPALRAALACRMARLSQAPTLAAHYESLLLETGKEAASARLADPACTDNGNPRDAALLRHVDLVTQSPQSATRGHIDALRDAGVAEADIVRLAELIAFVNYQLRVVAGLRLLGEIV